MAGIRPVREPAIIDFLEAQPRKPFEGTLWRAVRADRDPLRSSTPKGRWDDGSIEVLYTSLEADGAKAEIYFHLLRGQPVFPSRIDFHLFELQASLDDAIAVLSLTELAPAGIESSVYGTLAYARREEEYSPSQKLGEAAHFLGLEALIVPNARRDCLNAVLFMSHIEEESISIRKDHGTIDWNAWKKSEAASAVNR